MLAAPASCELFVPSCPSIVSLVSLGLDHNPASAACWWQLYCHLEMSPLSHVASGTCRIRTRLTSVYQLVSTRLCLPAASIIFLIFLLLFCRFRNTWSPLGAFLDQALFQTTLSGRYILMHRSVSAMLPVNKVVSLCKATLRVRTVVDLSGWTCRPPDFCIV